MNVVFVSIHRKQVIALPGHEVVVAFTHRSGYGGGGLFEKPRLHQELRNGRYIAATTCNNKPFEHTPDGTLEQRVCRNPLC